MAKQKQKPRVEKLLYGRQEAAFALGLSLRSISHMIADQRLRTRRYGTRVLIPAEDVRRVAELIIKSDMLQGNASTRTQH